MKKILIIGGAGFIGYHLSKFLISKKKYNVHIIDNLERGKIDKDLSILIKNNNIKFYKIDILNKSQINKISNDYDFIFQLAAIVGVSNVIKRPNFVLSKNVQIQINSIKIAINQKKLKKFFFFSTSEVYAGSISNLKFKFPTPENVDLTLTDLKNPRTTYLLSKIYGEAITIHSNIPYIILRPHNIYGPRMGFLHVIPELIYKFKKLKLNSSYKLDSHNHSRSFCYVDDAVYQIYKLILSNKKNLTINIGNDEREIKILDLANILKKIIKRNDIKILNKKNSNHSSPQRRIPDIKKIINISKSRNFVKLDDGIKRLYEWYEKI